jgi:predicted DNA-binding transcriptional regulator AlpA
VNGPDVYAAAEAAKVLGVGGARFRVLAQREGFPAPTELTVGRIWDGAEIRAYALSRHGARYQGRPLVLVVMLAHEGRSVAAIAQQVGVAWSTVERWLEACKARPARIASL